MDVVLAPRDAVPDAPACSRELISWPARSSSLPRDRSAQNCTVRLAANSPSIRTSSDSAAWNGGAEGGQVLGHPSHMTLEQSRRPAALNHAQHHPDNMRPQRHCSSSATRGRSQRCRSNEEIAVTQSRHSVPPTECRDYSAERCRGALERGGVPQRRRRPSSRNEPFVPLLTGVEMQPRARGRARHLTKEKNDNITRHTNIWRSYTYHCLADKSHTYYKLQHLAHSRKAA
eukprot:scaffold108954_cov68-Phaeocystis_antarctica.AAC.7